MRAKIVNIFSGPGCGKTTTAAGLFYDMKIKNYEVELVTEYAKDLVYNESYYQLKDQLYIFTRQHHNIWKLRDKLDYIILDSPLPLSLHYFVDNEIYNRKDFESLVLSTFNAYYNINVFLERDLDFQFQTIGRMQNLEQSIEIDESIKSILKKFNIPYVVVHANNAKESILKLIEKR